MEFEPRRLPGDPRDIRNRWLRTAWSLIRHKLLTAVIGCLLYGAAIELIDHHGTPALDDPWGLITWLTMVLAICATAPWFMAAIMGVAYAADHSRNAFALWRDLFLGSSRRLIGPLSLRTMLIYGGVLCGAQVALLALTEWLLVPAEPEQSPPVLWEPSGPIAWLLIGCAEHVWYAVLASPLAVALAELFAIPVLMRTESDRVQAIRLSALGVQRNLGPIRRCYVGLPLMLLAALLPGPITILGFGFASVVVYVAYREIYEARAENLPETAHSAAFVPAAPPG